MMTIKSVRIIPVSPDKGLIAFASVVIDDDIILNSIAVYRKLDGGLRLLYPSKKVGAKEFTVFHPLNHQTSKMLEIAIFEECKRVLEEECEDDRYDSTFLRH